MEIKENEIKFMPTANKDIFNKFWLVKETIDIKKLKRDIQNLKMQAAEVPELKEKPDQETLDFYNMMHSANENKETLNAKIAEKQSIVDRLEAISKK